MHTPYSLMHVASASIALLTGMFMVFAPKGNALHRLIGIIYAFAMLVSNMAALSMYSLTGHFNLFHAFALLSLGCIVTGIVMPVAKPRDWIARHALWMGWSYIGLLAAAANEAVIHLPLNIHGPARSIGAGVVIALVAAMAGRTLRPRLMREAREMAKARSAPEYRPA